MLYINKDLCKEEMRHAMSHLAGCNKCRLNLEKLEESQSLVLEKMGLLEPEIMPAPGFLSLGKKTGSMAWLEFFGLSGKPYRLRAISLATFGLLLAIPLFFWLLVPSSQANDPLKSPDLGDRFYIHSLSTSEKPARTYIVKDEKEKITFIWVEKKSKKKEV